MNDNNVIDIIDKLSSARVLVVGDVMMDRFVYGDVKRISPEGPVPVLLQKHERYMLGGAGNVISNLFCLGVQSALISICGDDEAADLLADLLKEHDVDRDGLCIVPGRKTTLKTRYMASNQQLLRADYEDTGEIDTETEEKILARFAEELKTADIVLISDYGKGVLTQSLISQIMTLSNAAGKDVLVDPKGGDYSKYKGAFAVTPNREELSDAAGYEIIQDDAAIEDGAREVIRQNGINAVIATRSEAGMSVIEADKDQVVHIRTKAREVYDVSGAGDTVIATVAAALAAGSDLPQAAALANEAGAVVVAKIGTAPIYIDELKAQLLKNATAHAAVFDVKVAGASAVYDVLDIVGLWKSQGHKVGFTNGCFDILHSGHTTYLSQTKEHCDKLILGLNSDMSVRRLKGETRPVNVETDRAIVMAALDSVDIVVLFGDDPRDNDQPCVLIDKLRPDVIFKGGDYKEEDLPEAKVARAYGGDVQILSLVEGRSTTNTIQKMKEI